MELSEQLVRALRNKQPVDWLEGLGLHSSVVRQVVANSNIWLAWGFERLGFKEGETVFTDQLRWTVFKGDLKSLQHFDAYIEKTDWQQILAAAQYVYGAVTNGTPAMLDWLETKGVGADFWQMHLERAIEKHTCVKHLDSIEWLLRKGVSLSPSVAEDVCYSGIRSGNVEFLRKLKESGAVIKPTNFLLRALVSYGINTSRVAETLGFTLADLKEEFILAQALARWTPALLEWLAKEKITPQQCRLGNNAAINAAMAFQNTEYLEWLWNVGLTLDEFVLSAQKHAPRKTHPQVYAWLDQKRKETICLPS